MGQCKGDVNSIALQGEESKGTVCLTRKWISIQASDSDTAKQERTRICGENHELSGSRGKAGKISLAEVQRRRMHPISRIMSQYDVVKT